MKIVEQTSTVLKLRKEENAWIDLIVTSICSVYSALFMSVPVFLLPLTITEMMNARPKTLECNHLEPNQVTCELSYFDFFAKLSTPMKIRQIQRAEAQVTKREYEDGTSYNFFQVTLITKNARIPLDMFSNQVMVINKNDSIPLSFNSDGDKITAKINAFIGNSQQMSFKIYQDHDWGTYISVTLTILLSSYCIFGLINTAVAIFVQYPYSCIFDKSSSLIYVKSRNMLKSKTTEEVLDLDEIQEVKDTEKYGVYCTTDLILKTGKQIRLYYSYSSSENEQFAQTINKFLGIKS